MAKWWFFGAIAVGLTVAAAGVAVADSFASSQATAYFAAGKHQFYVWCASGHDYTTVAAGKSAEDAQMTLYAAVKAAGHTCWPVWQGKVPG